jgi:hypothetical protein
MLLLEKVKRLILKRFYAIIISNGLFLLYILYSNNIVKLLDGLIYFIHISKSSDIDNYLIIFIKYLFSI